MIASQSSKKAVFVPGQSLVLQNGKGELFGSLVIEELKDNWVLGRFSAGPAFAETRPLFEELVAAANEMCFSRVDEIEQQIEAKGIHLAPLNGETLPRIFNITALDSSIDFRFQQPITT